MKQSTYLRRAISALKNEGWILVSVDDGDGRPQKVANTREAMEIVTSVEIADLFFSRGDGETSHVRVVWQGPDESYEEGEEIISDYGMRLDPILSKLSSDDAS